jgi:GntR family transcriptional regulator
MPPLDELSPRSLNHPHRAKYRQLADRLSQLIADGYLQPGEKLPSEAKLAEQVEVSKTTVRDALDLLERDGQIERRNGVPARVVEPRDVRTISDQRYFEEDRLIAVGVEATSSAFTRNYRIAWDDYRIDLEIKREPATPKDRALLHLPDDVKMVWRRYFLKYADADRRRPVEIQRSCITEEVAAACPWMIQRDNQPYPGGTQRELADGGFRVDRITRATESRLPSEEEKGDLRIAEVPVFAVERVFWSGGRPVEASRVIMPAALVKIVDETVLPG